MYSFSHRPNGGWIGEFETPQQALITGRAKYGEAKKIFIGQWEPAFYSDFLPNVEILISMMREAVSDRLGDEQADAFDYISPEQRATLEVYLQTAMGEWEAELPEEMQFTGQHVKTIVGYERLDEVRKSDFS